MKLTQFPEYNQMTWSLHVGLPSVYCRWVPEHVSEWEPTESGGRELCLHMLDIIRQLLHCVCSCSRPTTFNYMAHKLGHWSASCFPVKVCEFALSSCTFRSGHLHQQLRKKKKISWRIVAQTPFVLYTHKQKTYAVYSDMFAQCMKATSMFADCQANRTVLLFINSRVAASTKTVASPLRFLIGNNTPCRTGALVRRVDQITRSHISWLSCAESRLDVAQK